MSAKKIFLQSVSNYFQIQLNRSFQTGINLKYYKFVEEGKKEKNRITSTIVKHLLRKFHVFIRLYLFGIRLMNHFNLIHQR